MDDNDFKAKVNKAFAAFMAEAEEAFKEQFPDVTVVHGCVALVPIDESMMPHHEAPSSVLDTSSGNPTKLMIFADIIRGAATGYMEAMQQGDQHGKH